MTDSEMTKAAAEQVMKWKVVPAKFKGPGTENMIEFSCPDRCNVFYWPGCHSDYAWNPLVFDSNTFMLVDALPEREIKIGRLGPYWTVDIGMRQCTSKDRRRAIVLAALRAVGVEA